MSDRRRIITFTNLYPSAAMPQHGTFVQERMTRVVAGQDDLELVVVSPLPAVPRLLARGEHAVLRRGPACESVDGVPVHHPRYFHLPGLSLGKQAERMARAALPVVRALAVGRRCVLDAHYVYPDGVAAVRIAEELGLPCLVTARGTDVNVLAEHKVVAPQVRAAMPRAHALLAVSEALRRRFAEVAGVPDARVELLRNGVDLERFHPGERAAARARLGLPATAGLVLGIGRLVAGKGFGLAVQALASLPGHVHLVLVGEGPERAALRQAAPVDRLHLLGRRGRDDVVAALQACDVLVLPSAREGWPNVVTEALASGLPVVATAVGGIPEMVADPVAGELVAADPEALASALLRQLARGECRNAIAAYAQRYSWHQPIARLRAVLRAA
ncbi:MAG: glycosyltransferase [Planctomycetota bacterium]